MAVGENCIQMRPLQKLLERLQRQGGCADLLHFAVLSQPLQRRNGLFHQLVERSKFDVLTLDQVDVGDSQSPQTFIHALRDPPGRKIQPLFSCPIAANFCRQIELLARNLPQGLAEDALGPRVRIIRRDIDEIDAEINRSMGPPEAKRRNPALRLSSLFGPALGTSYDGRAGLYNARLHQAP